MEKGVRELFDPDIWEALTDIFERNGFNGVRVSCRASSFSGADTPFDTPDDEEEMLTSIDDFVGCIHDWSESDQRKYWSNRRFTLEGVVVKGELSDLLLDNDKQPVAACLEQVRMRESDEDRIEVVSVGELVKTLRRLPAEFCTAALSSLKAEELDSIEASVHAARRRNCHKLVFGSLDIKPSLSKARLWLKTLVEIELTSEQKLNVSRAIQWLNDEHGIRTYYKKGNSKIECLITTGDRKDRGVRRFRFYEPGKGSKDFSAPQQIPEELTLDR